MLRLLACLGLVGLVAIPGDAQVPNLVPDKPSGVLGPTRTVLSQGGLLAQGDKMLAGERAYLEVWPIQCVGGEVYTVQMESNDLIPYVWVQKSSRIGKQARIRGATGEWQGAPERVWQAVFSFTAPETGRYNVVASAIEPSKAGHYTLKVWRR